MPVPSGPIRQATGFTTGGSTSLPIVFAANPATTSTVLVLAPGGVASVTGLGATWTRLLAVTGQEWWAGVSPNGSSATVTITLAAPFAGPRADGMASEWGNLDATVQVSAGGLWNGGTGQAQVPITATNNNGLVVWGYYLFAGGSPAVQGGYTALTVDVQSLQKAAYRIDAASSGVAYSPAYQPSVADSWSWTALVIQGSPLSQQDLTGPHTGPGTGGAIADITGVPSPEGLFELVLYSGTNPAQRLTGLHRAYARSFRDEFNATGSGSFRIPELPAFTSTLLTLSNPLPTGNVLVVTGTTRTVLPGCDLSLPGTQNVTVSWDVWISHQNVNTFKQELLELRRDGVNGEVLASFTTPVADGGDNSTGHQFRWNASFVDAVPATGRYVLTVQEIAAGAGNPANTQIRSDTRIFTVTGQQAIATTSISDQVIRCYLQGRLVFAYLTDAPVKTVASPDGPAGEFWTVSGRGMESYLEREIWYPTGWGAGGPVFPTRVTGSLTAGGWLRRFVDEAKTRNAFLAVTTDFTSSVDSAGIAWTTTLALEFPVGANGLALVDELRRQGVVIRMSPELLLQAYQSYGEDRSAAVVIRQGPHIRDSVPVDFSTAATRTRMLVQGAETNGLATFLEAIDGTAEQETGLPRRAGVVTGTSTDEGFRAIAAALTTQQAITVAMNSSLEPGGYHAYFHAHPGDYVALDIPGTYTREVFRVIAFTVTQTKLAYDVDATLGSARRQVEVELAQRLKRLEAR